MASRSAGCVVRYSVRHSVRSAWRWWLPLQLLWLAALPLNAQTRSESHSAGIEALKAAVVTVRAEIPAAARTAERLGMRREGSGVVIDSKGLVLTIGYLILEAVGIEIVDQSGNAVPGVVIGYDSDSGFGLVRSNRPLSVQPVPLGDSDSVRHNDPVLMIDGGGQISPAVVVSRRNFAGYWEYLLEQAIFTSPPYRNFAGTALVDREFRLVGIGSLILADAVEQSTRTPGNMFVPINHFKPVRQDLLDFGRPRAKAKPWLGLNVAEQYGRVVITRVSEAGPASQAGLEQGDIILQVEGHKVADLETFYRKVWRMGPAGVSVNLTLLQGATITQRSLRSGDRYQHYRFIARP